MAIQVGTVDGLINISEQPIKCFVEAIDIFSAKGISFAKANNISFGTAFQRFVEPVYTSASSVFNVNSILRPALTGSGNEQSPARVTYCKKMGLLQIDESNEIFRLTPLGELVKDNEISVSEYAFVLLTKMGIFVNGELVDNLFCSLARYFKEHATISDEDYKSYVISQYNDDSISKTRFDIIIGALCTSGLITKVAKNVYALSSTLDSRIFEETLRFESQLKSSLLDNDPNYAEFVGSLNNGIFSILNEKNIDVYTSRYKNFRKFISNANETTHLIASINKNNIPNLPLQQIFYGAPGTGKSHSINEHTKGESVIRTTFHPDSDYSTFVGAYKPTMGLLPICDELGQPMKIGSTVLHKEQIMYEFVEQAFLQAYVRAWKNIVFNEGKKQYLIIEEINRGNCAQIFGDLFQLLDRNEYGFSDYPIQADKDMQKFLKKAFARTDEPDKQIFLKEEEKQRINQLYKDREDVMSKVFTGEILLLPNNLFIWATMNTSDQSLFPIDSAFKRRWDWKYVPISKKDENYKIEVKKEDGLYHYDWWEFLDRVNTAIAKATSSEDKKLGYFFCKADEKGVITADRFVSKVVFYIWNDVFKDYEVGDAKFHYGEDDLSLLSIKIGDEEMKREFSSFFDEQGNANHKTVANLLDDLKIECEPVKEGKEGDNSGSNESTTADGFQG